MSTLLVFRNLIAVFIITFIIMTLHTVTLTYSFHKLFFLNLISFLLFLRCCHFSFVYFLLDDHAIGAVVLLSRRHIITQQSGKLRKRIQNINKKVTSTIEWNSS